MGRYHERPLLFVPRNFSTENRTREITLRRNRLDRAQVSVQTFLMIRFICLILLLKFSITAHGAKPSAGTAGIGAMAGTMGAIQAKYFFTQRDALDIAIEFMDEPWTVLFADYYVHLNDAFGKTSNFSRQSQLYLGAGAGTGFWSRKQRCGRWKCKWDPLATGTGTGFFVRLVVGAEWFFAKKPFGFFIEFAPSYMLHPTTGTAFDAVVGSRFYF